MNSGEITIEESRSVEDVHELRLMALLRDLVREKKVRGAADALGVDPRTLASSLVRRRLSKRMSDALERLLLTGGVPEMARQGERIDDLERGMQGLGGRVEALEKEMRSGFEDLRTTVENEVNALREEWNQAMPESDRPAVQAEAHESTQGGGNASARDAVRLKPQSKIRRDDPLVLTEAPEPDDEEFYGAVWPLIAEWRELRASHPNAGKGLSWLVEEERLMEVEVSLIEDHGFTLPPEREALRGLAIRSQLTWRRKALYDTRRARIKRERLRWVRRILTLGLWRK